MDLYCFTVEPLPPPPLQVAEEGVLIKGYVLMFTLYDGMSRGICSGHRLRGIQEKEGGGEVGLNFSFRIYVINIGSQNIL